MLIMTGLYLSDLIIQNIIIEIYYRITSIDVNPNWGPGNMFCVSAGEDRIVKLWDLENYTSKCVNNSHMVSMKNKMWYL